VFTLRPVEVDAAGIAPLTVDIFETPSLYNDESSAPTLLGAIKGRTWSLVHVVPLFSVSLSAKASIVPCSSISGR
jgi:hypothetical protein